ncbi:MFS transporter [Streptomyces ipomoeae]|uniref:MFS transporter n=1 Tax=Streptomyces ipomoeae TaxID=103232 RepID=A0AAE8W2G9_9ACTN|nr:MFS transporter [Streptomyces ipomoeae]TQE34190.1 MFS transporter [Streptomyces ipomoeae]
MPRSTTTSGLPSGWLARCYLLRAADGVAGTTVMYAVPLIILTTTGSVALTGLAFLLEWLPRLLTMVGAGPLVDRRRPERVFAYVCALRTLAAVATGTALLLADGGAASAVVLSFGVLSGMLTEVSFLAVESLGAQASRHASERAHRVQAVLVGIDQSALLAGPLLGGLLLLAGPTVLLTALAALSLFAAVGACGLPSTLRSADSLPKRPSTPWAGLLIGCQVIASRPALGWLVASMTTCGLISGVLHVSAPITLTADFEFSTATAGTVWSIATVPSLLAIAAAHRVIDRLGLWATGLTGAAALSVAALTAALATSALVYGIALAVLLSGEGVLSVVLRTARARLIPPAVFASTLAVTLLMILAPFPLAGALVAALPPSRIPTLVLTCALLQMAVTAVGFRGLWHHRSAYTDIKTSTNRAWSAKTQLRDAA